DQISEAFGDAGELQFHLTPSCPKRAYGGISGQVREHPALLARTAPKCGVFSRSARRVRGESDLDLTGDDLVAQLLELGLDLVGHLRVELVELRQAGAVVLQRAAVRLGAEGALDRVG